MLMCSPLFGGFQKKPRIRFDDVSEGQNQVLEVPTALFTDLRRSLCLGRVQINDFSGETTSGAAIPLAPPGASGSNRVDKVNVCCLPTAMKPDVGLLPHPTSY